MRTSSTRSPSRPEAAAIAAAVGRRPGSSGRGCAVAGVQGGGEGEDRAEVGRLARLGAAGDLARRPARAVGCRRRSGCVPSPWPRTSRGRRPARARRRSARGPAGWRSRSCAVSDATPGAIGRSPMRARRRSATSQAPLAPCRGASPGTPRPPGGRRGRRDAASPRSSARRRAGSVPGRVAVAVVDRLKLSRSSTSAERAGRRRRRGHGGLEPALERPAVGQAGQLVGLGAALGATRLSSVWAWRRAFARPRVAMFARPRAIERSCVGESPGAGGSCRRGCREGAAPVHGGTAGRLQADADQRAVAEIARAGPAAAPRRWRSPRSPASGQPGRAGGARAAARPGPMPPPARGTPGAPAARSRWCRRLADHLLLNVVLVAARPIGPEGALRRVGDGASVVSTSRDAPIIAAASRTILSELAVPGTIGPHTRRRADD